MGMRHRDSRGPRHRDGHAGGPRGGRPRRTPPQDATGLEQRFLRESDKREQRFRVQFLDGESLEAAVELMDDELLRLTNDDGERIVRKSDVRYLEEC